MTTALAPIRFVDAQLDAVERAALSQPIYRLAEQVQATKDPNGCHGCGIAVQGGIITPCTSCGNWGVFCASCSPSGQTWTRCQAVDIEEPRGYFSPSQIEAFDLCIRKWAWRYIDGIRVPSNQFAQFGQRGHFQIEQYLLTGAMFDLTTPEGEAAMSGIHLLPQPGTPGMTVEQAWYMTGWGHLFHGKKDIQIDRVVGSYQLPGEAPIVTWLDSLNGQRIPIVIDHKFVGSFRFAHTADTLIKNVQAALYAADAMLRFKAPAVDLRWIYYLRNAPHKAKPVDVRVYRKDLEPALESICDSAHTMGLIKLSGLRSKDLPPNPAACAAFGGCPYVRHCDLSPREALIATMSEQTGPQNGGTSDMKNAFLEEVRRKLAAQGGNGTAVNPPPVGAVPPQGPPAWAPQPQAGPPQGPPAQPPPQNWTPPPQPPAQAAPPQGPPAWAQNAQPPSPQGPPPFQPPPQPQAGPPPFQPQGPPAQAAPPPQVQPPSGPPQFTQDGAQFWIPGMSAWAPMPQDNIVRSPDGSFFWAPVGQSWVPITSLGANPSPVLNPATGAPPQGSAPMPPQTGDAASAAEGEKAKNKGGRPPGSKNKVKADASVQVDPNADPLDLAVEGLDMIITGFVLVKQALIKITGRAS